MAPSRHVTGPPARRGHDGVAPGAVGANGAGHYDVPATTTSTRGAGAFERRRAGSAA